MRTPLTLLPGLALVAACATTPLAKEAAMSTATLMKGASLLAAPAASFTATCEDALDKAKAHLAALKALPPGSDAKALALYDEATTLVSNASARAGLSREVHPDAAFRAAAEACEQKLEAFNVEIAQDRALYDALSKVDTAKADAPTRYWLFKALREFRRAGVDRDEATRAQVKALNDELVKIGQAFARNIRDDVRTVKFTAAELDGVPADWLKEHPVGADGTIAVTTNTPDYLPVMLYAKRAATREALWREQKSRAYPANEPVLKELLAKRHALATLLGYASWAAFATETRMVKTKEAAQDFIERGRTATLRRAEKDMAVLLERKKKDVPQATSVEPWEQDFYEDRVKNEQYGLDSQALRAFFEYGAVKRGVMDITGRLFGVRYEKVADAQTWHPDVETFDLFDGATKLGRIHLDMHPRENKYKHAAQFGLTTGRGGKDLPEAVLVCNFPRPGGLMQHSEVETFFHEFGHLLHEIFGGRQPYAALSGTRTEWDFVEVPSMLLQEWPLDASVLKAFALHHETKAPMPDALIAQLRAAKEFGVGLMERRQFFLAAVSLDFHARAPGFDTNVALKEVQERFLPFRREWVDGTHFELAFGHLDGYSATYYTYLWSTVIAKDLLTRFTAAGMLDATTARDYRQKVLEAGGGREAAASVEYFLGRPYDFKAFETWLNAN